MKPLRLALTYDCKEDYLASGFAPEAVMEFDSQQTIDAVNCRLKYSSKLLRTSDYYTI